MKFGGIYVMNWIGSISRQSEGRGAMPLLHRGVHPSSTPGGHLTATSNFIFYILYFIFYFYILFLCFIFMFYVLFLCFIFMFYVLCFIFMFYFYVLCCMFYFYVLFLCFIFMFYFYVYFYFCHS